jgi:hypothetical protein
MDTEEFQKSWSQMTSAETFTHVLETVAEQYRSLETLQTRLVHNNIFFVTKQQKADGDGLYFSARSVKSAVFLLETTISAGGSRVAIALKATDPQLSQHFIQAVTFLLSTSY